jgi:two-component system nitrogen regulation sensor histidine kinase NtrY
MKRFRGLTRPKPGFVRQVSHMAELAPLDSKERRKRKREYIAIVLLGVLFVLLTIAEFRLTKLSAMLPFVNSIFFFGLLNFNIVVLIALVWLVLRNVGKLFIERRRQVLGSRLKTKLVISFFSFSIIPTLVLFFIAALYINSSFDKWFSLKIQNTFQASLDITHTYYKNTVQNAMHFAQHLSTGIGTRLTSEERFKESHSASALPPAWIENYLSSQRELLALDAVELYFDPLAERVMSRRPPNDNDYKEAPPNEADTEETEGPSPATYPRLPLDLLEKAFSGERVSVMQHIGSGDLIRCLVPVYKNNQPGGTVLSVMVVDAYIPVSLVNKVDEIASVSDDYKYTNPLKYPMKTTYLVILIMITLVVLFVAIWIGLYMAREITYPIERLVKGAQAVGAGNLNVAIQSSGRDEISVLIESFNKMTRDLRDNQHRLTEAGADLERRRLQLEAVLGNINTGVIAINSSKEITIFNQAVGNLLGVDFKTAEGREFEEVLRDQATPLMNLINETLSSQQSDSAPNSVPETLQWTAHSATGGKNLAAVVTRLREAGNQWGVVAVIDDMTHLIKGQREMAWREVARRIAHEIKNPLTPIKLSAQRLQRRLGDYGGKNGEILQECTETIIKHTDELKEMVNEFSNFARFPEVSPAPNDLNEALGEVVKLYRQAHPGCHFKTEFESRLPIFEFDRDQIKRVAINLLDNAIAIKPRQIQVATHYNGQLQMAVVEVADNGPGMSEEIKARVFEPYFSTKTGGTGLGLAIAKRIINDHDGFIRVQSVLGEGTKFVIELPTAVRQGMSPDVQASFDHRR